MKLVERLGGLRVEVDVVCEVKFFHIFKMRYHDGMVLCLSDESQHLGVSRFAEDDYLCVGAALILAAYAALQL